MKIKIGSLLAGLMMVGLISGIAFATPIDLTKNDSVTASDGSVWMVVQDQPTGTGVFKPFLRLGNSPIEAGLNTDEKHVQVYDDQGGGDGWTHSLTWGDLAIVAFNGGQYYDFTLDINEVANKTDKYLSLDVFQLYAYSGILGGSATETSQLGAPVYDLADSSPIGAPVYMDYSLSSSGSGKDDIEVLIPVIEGIDPSDFFYLYSSFGAVGTISGNNGNGNGNERNFGSSDGFEEWRVLQTSTNVPEPSALLLLGSGLLALRLFRRFKN